MFEIERKFLVAAMPDLTKYNNYDIKQGYINYEPEIRVRKEDNEFYLTEKSSELLKRTEINIPLSADVYEIIYKMIKGNLIHKTRFEIPLSDDLTAELDLYHGKLDGLCTVEIEFKTEHQANSFVPPVWFGQEVTNDKKFKNVNLSQCDSIDFIKI